MKQDKLVSNIFEKYERDWPPLKHDAFFGWFQEKLHCIPDDLRHSAMIDIGCVIICGNSFPIIEVRYSRPETADEEDDRKRIESMRTALQRENDLRMLSALQDKYGKSENAC